MRVLTCALLDSVFLSRFISERYCRRRDEEAAGDLLLLPPPAPPLLGRLCGDWRWCDDDIEEIAAIERALKVELKILPTLTWFHFFGKQLDENLCLAWSYHFPAAAQPRPPTATQAPRSLSRRRKCRPGIYKIIQNLISRFLLVLGKTIEGFLGIGNNSNAFLGLDEGGLFCCLLFLCLKS